MSVRSTWACLALWTAAAAVFARPPATYSEGDFPRVDKVDMHVHLYGELPVFVSRAKADGFHVLTINVNYTDFPPLSEQLASAIALRRAYPGQVAFAATFDAADSERPEWLASTQKHLETALVAGAVAVKVWKDIGMQWRDADGRVVMIDDARFAPVFDLLEKRGVVVLGHQGEPRNAWLPLVQMTINGDREYFGAHPHYHMALHPEWPTYEQQLAARDHMLDAHPALQFVGVHLASLEWDVGRVAAFLDRYPNARVDLAARMPHLQRQAVSNRDKVREFFIRYQDRILYGTDITRGKGQGDAALADEAHEVWIADWKFLAGDGVSKSAEFDGAFRGLALPRAVIDKVYGINAQQLLPRAWKPDEVTSRIGGPAKSP
jgi:predicted TIM-barrel fold metal-dependent hydrolase